MFTLSERGLVAKRILQKHYELTRVSDKLAHATDAKLTSMHQLKMNCVICVQNFRN